MQAVSCIAGRFFTDWATSKKKKIHDTKLKEFQINSE